MKFYILLILCLFNFSAFSQSITLNKAIEIAKFNNIELKILGLDSRKLREDSQNNLYSHLPSLGFNISQHNNNGLIFDQITGQLLRSSQWLNSSSLGLNSSLSLYEGNRKRLDKRKNTLSDLLIKRQIFEKGKQITLSVATVYMDATLKKLNIESNSNAVQISKSLYERISELEKFGKISKIEQLSINDQLEIEKNKLFLSEIELKKAILNLKKELGINLDSTIGDLQQFESFEQSTLMESREENINEMNTSYEAVLKNAITHAKSFYQPNLSANSTYNTNFSSVSPVSWGNQLNLNRNFYVGFSLNVPIFDNRNIRTNVNKLKYELEIEKIKGRERIQLLKAQQMGYKDDLEAAKFEYEISIHEFKQQERKLDEYTQKFLLGKESLFNVVEEKNRLLRLSIVKNQKQCSIILLDYIIQNSL